MESSHETFSTSASAMVPGVLVTSNGHSGVDREQLGSTSSNLKNSSLLGDAGGV